MTYQVCLNSQHLLILKDLSALFSVFRNQPTDSKGLISFVFSQGIGGRLSFRYSLGPLHVQQKLALALNLLIEKLFLAKQHGPFLGYRREGLVAHGRSEERL